MSEVVRPNFPEFIDSTARKDFDACPTKFYYNHVLKIRREGASVHLHFGKCLAAGLEAFRKAFFGEDIPFMQCYARAVHSIIYEWGWEEFEDEKKTLETCILAFDSYIQQYPPYEDPVRPAMFNGKPAVEFNFALPIPDIKHPQTGDPILYTGRFDMLADYEGMPMIEDDKSASQLGRGWQTQWRMASQMTGYCWAAKEYDIKVEGVIIRGIGIYANGFRHEQILEHRSQWFIDRWLAQLQRDVRRMIDMWESGVWDMSLDSACAAYGGCPYLTLCESPHPERWIETDFVEHDWNPLD